MPIKSFKDILKEMEEVDAICNGSHDLEEKSSRFGCAGRFGGHTYPLYKCNRCGLYIADEEKKKEAESYYDEGGRPLPFYQLYLNNVVPADFIDNYISEWHEGDSKLTIYEYLGMSKEHYRKWVQTGEL